MPASTCSTPRQGRSSPRKSKPAESADTPLILGSDHPLLKQAHQNLQESPDAVPVSRLLIWPVAARLRWRVAFS